MTDQSRMKLIVMHGWGGSYLEAAARVTDLLQVESCWHNGSFVVPRRRAGLLRHLLNEPAADRYVTALRKLIISRFMQSPVATAEVIRNENDYSRFSEDRLRHDFPAFGIPFGSEARWQRAIQLQEEAQQELQPVLDALQSLQTDVAEHKDHWTEAAIRDRLRQRTTESGAGDLVFLLENLREMHETGGDLDTVASAVLYAHHFADHARRTGVPFRYGIEYRFVFLNYHETLRGLVKHAPSDLYAADLPIAAFPELENDIRWLHAQGVHTVRFEDHHPYHAARSDTLQQLVDEGCLDFFALSGPVQGDEQEEEEQRCAADMVYENLVQNTPADVPAAKRLRQAAHGEDFVRERTPLGILLTDLIKGGICKVELGQILLAAMEQDDARALLEQRGWAQLPETWKADIQATAETLRENTYELKLADGKTTILSALAVHADPGKPKLPTGKAIEFFAQNFPHAQYAFYSWGASIMVARRLDQADTTLNLGSLMPAIGSEGDGGHAGAAVCRPEANPAFPKRLLGRVPAARFGAYNRYLASRLASEGYPVESIHNVSVPPASLWSRGNRRLVIILIGAILLGTGLVTLLPSYHPEAVRASNRDFFPQLDVEDDPTHDTMEAVL